MDHPRKTTPSPRKPTSKFGYPHSVTHGRAYTYFYRNRYIYNQIECLYLQCLSVIRDLLPNQLYFIADDNFNIFMR